MPSASDRHCTCRTVTPTRDDVRIAWLAALAVAIHVAETLVPSPVPGMRPGFANVIVVVVLLLYGWRAALWVALLRVVAGSLLIGTFLSPTFLLSLSGALAAMLALRGAQRLPGIGPVGLSVLASMGHVLGQFLVAWQLLLPHPQLPVLLPILLTGAVAFGWLNGMMAAALVRGEGRRREA